jgi:hypothetical protein
VVTAELQNSSSKNTDPFRVSESEGFK